MKAEIKYNLEIVPSEKWEESCDFCESQEDSHYCLFWSQQIKNMDLKTCRYFKEKTKEATP